MPAQWTADLIGKMHLHKITAKELSEELGKHPKYVSQIMNGHRLPKKAEEEFNLALNRLIEKKTNS